ncbi:hypothetical protein [Paracidovorax wautersii]|uniref:Uncharacterized protein n=1 Tax=Paracidovorax wautersii TaxID=1177982 RepID=A0A1I2GE00_9BURK|nr:hypothetical protein [Paracidovorax wautersii]SFF14881.1 hypothetical protein SAMN04489711_11469 [Paracidovorax wautersii]
MTEKTISPEQLAVLAERVDTLINSYSRLEGIIIGIGTQQGQLSNTVGVVGEKLAQLDAGQKRLFQLSDEFGADLDRVKADIKVHSWTWKLVGIVAMSSLGMVGWAFGELRALQSSDNRHDNRLTLLEFIVGGRQPSKLQEAPKP